MRHGENLSVRPVWMHTSTFGQVKVFQAGIGNMSYYNSTQHNGGWPMLKEHSGPLGAGEVRKSGQVS